MAEEADVVDVQNAYTTLKKEPFLEEGLDALLAEAGYPEGIHQVYDHLPDGSADEINGLLETLSQARTQLDDNLQSTLDIAKDAFATWTGDAARAFETYVGDLQDYVNQLMDYIYSVGYVTAAARVLVSNGNSEMGNIGYGFVTAVQQWEEAQPDFWDIALPILAGALTAAIGGLVGGLAAAVKAGTTVALTDVTIDTIVGAGGAALTDQLTPVEGESPEEILVSYLESVEKLENEISESATGIAGQLRDLAGSPPTLPALPSAAPGPDFQPSSTPPEIIDYLNSTSASAENAPAEPTSGVATALGN
jgi:hypothetical protein